ncbi:MAG: hypothetical protein OH319_04665 [Candidatus Parvarchaeota archaeon]|nr:hypothetical protein [Candidatus Jingweiarchaeum tengchongense]MCW1298651.1 hypothetical protein [Candidatus Jingweiarchaeum tengchongense]MCW1300493.1 hypothetical protein [Candidatus Jingweiarchaeum tengchongense]MCW1304692.1 hypothetical protein [Candidatus Jingweiarchaeum tengchongense]MCW1305881.1 hypothetical protein [Candidatus Jingweiarchaeum tengchongense]
MKPPCEDIAKNFLPYVRGYLVRELVKEYGMKKIEVAKKFALTKGAVSHYVNKKRGREDKFFERFGFVEIELKRIAKRISKENLNSGEIIYCICGLCKKIRSSRKFCEHHKRLLEIKECRTCGGIKNEKNIS